MGTGSGCFLSGSAEASRKVLPVCPFCHLSNLYLMAIPHPRLLKYITGVNGGNLVNKGETTYFALIFYINSHGIFQLLKQIIYDRDMLTVLKF